MTIATDDANEIMARHTIGKDDPQSPQDGSGPIRLKRRRCCDFGGNPEARAWAMNSVSQGVLIIGAVYLATAILGLAKEAAGCDGPKGVMCENKILGTKPSSLLTIMTSVTSFASSLMMPFLGAIIDHTDYRRCVAIGSGWMCVMIMALQATVSIRTWGLAVILYTVAPVVFLIHTTVMLAYLPDISANELQATRWISSYQVIRQSTMLIQLLVVLGLTNYLQEYIGKKGTLEFDVNTARISQVIITVVSAITIFFTFFRGMKSRRALSEVPAGSNIFTTGFKKLYTTAREISRTLPAIKWYLICCVFYGSILGATIAIAITYMNFFLRFNATETGVSTFIYLFASVCGAAVLPFIVLKIGVLNAFKCVIFLWTVMWGIIGLVIQGPEQKYLFFIFSTVWGFLAGMVIPGGRILYMAIIPKGQESELMGIYLFAINGFVFVPPMVLTAMNEAGISLRISMSVLSVFTLLALIALFLMGDLETAKRRAAEVTKLREGQEEEQENDVQLSEEGGHVKKEDVEGEKEEFLENPIATPPPSAFQRDGMDVVETGDTEGERNGETSTLPTQ